MSSEILLYGGIGIMILAVVLAAAGCITFRHLGKRLEKKLEEEYGKPYHS